jgi:hypothetical protein
MFGYIIFGIIIVLIISILYYVLIRSKTVEQPNVIVIPPSVIQNNTPQKTGKAQKRNKTDQSSVDQPIDDTQAVMIKHDVTGLCLNRSDFNHNNRYKSGLVQCQPTDYNQHWKLYPNGKLVHLQSNECLASDVYLDRCNDNNFARFDKTDGLLTVSDTGDCVRAEIIGGKPFIMNGRCIPAYTESISGSGRWTFLNAPKLALNAQIDPRELPRIIAEQQARDAAIKQTLQSWNTFR